VGLVESEVGAAYIGAGEGLWLSPSLIRLSGIKECGGRIQEAVGKRTSPSITQGLSQPYQGREVGCGIEGPKKGCGARHYRVLEKEYV
jgi:hypothetical protein